jgi:hypothetical protein
VILKDLANALGVESIESEGAAQASVTQEFNIATPREKSIWREVLEGDLDREVLEEDRVSLHTRGSQVSDQTKIPAPANVDADIAPGVRKRRTRWDKRYERKTISRLN